MTQHAVCLLLCNKPPPNLVAWIENRVSNTYFCTHIHSCIIHNSQKVEATQVSIDGWINKMWYIHKMEPLKGRKFYTCYNMDEPWGHYAKWNKPVTKGQIQWFQLYKVPRRVKFIETERRIVIARGLEVYALCHWEIWRTCKQWISWVWLKVTVRWISFCINVGHAWDVSFMGSCTHVHNLANWDTYDTIKFPLPKCHCLISFNLTC